MLTPHRLAAVVGGLSFGLAGAALASPVEPSAGAPDAGGYRVVRVTDGLNRPWGMVWLPDGSALITEREGRIRLLGRDGKLAPEAIKGLPSVLATGQGGLLDITIHPKFAENRWVYFVYSTGEGGSNTTRLSRGTLSADAASLTDVKDLFDLSPRSRGGLHFGSRLAWMPDGTLLMSAGDRFGPRNDKNVAQNKGVTQAKIVRLTDEGKPASGNPFAGEKDAAPEVWSMGHRNIQGMTVDPTGRVWATEHGPMGGDELNLIEKGKNYGWPLVTFGREYSGATITEERHRDGMEDAKLVWVPSIAASGLAFYSGDKFPKWTGSLLAGGLVSNNVWRISVDKA
nr:PQQ-dependent sugar dehydrogenase [Phycisphaerales bacterium]